MFRIGGIQELPARRQAGLSIVPEVTILGTIKASLPFLASFLPADMHLYQLIDPHRVKVIGEAKPGWAPSFYRRSHLDVITPLTRLPVLAKSIQSGDPLVGCDGQIINGLPMHQRIHPIDDATESPIGALVVERNLNEIVRHGSWQGLYRRLGQEMVEEVLASARYETRSLPPMLPGDAMIAVDPEGRIVLADPMATNLARMLGIRDLLEGADFNDRFDGGTWRVLEMNPLFAEQELRWGETLILVRLVPLQEYAVLVLRDVTELRHKDQQIAVKSAIIQEVHHRVKNNLQAMVSLLRLQSRRCKTDEAKEVLGDSISRVHSIALVHEYLAHQDVEVVDLNELSANILSAQLQSMLGEETTITTALHGSGPILYPSAQATSVALILNELLQNVVKHAFKGRPKGHIDVTLDNRPDGLLISVADNGVGLPGDFDPETSSNLGWRIVLTLVHDDLKGQLRITNEAAGTRITIQLPPT